MIERNTQQRTFTSDCYVQLDPKTFKPDENGEWFSRDPDQAVEIVKASHCGAIGVHIRTLSSDQLTIFQSEMRRTGAPPAYLDLFNKSFSFNSAVKLEDKQPV